MVNRQRIVILGAAGRDFHVFNTLYRARPDVEVVAFTATQIPNITDRRYPPELAGPHHPAGIPIVDEDSLESLISDHGVEQVVFAYSDVTHEHVMHLAARAVAAGAEFVLPGDAAMLAASKSVVAVTASRTGAGKSPVSRLLRSALVGAGHRVAVIRHPMPYGDLVSQRVQRFATMDDLAAADVTIEEREEYEPYVAEGSVIFAGDDYAAILAMAEQEADVILWDGGNNDVPFIEPTVRICLVDPHRPGDELRYWPGEANLRAADIVVVSKASTADAAGLAEVRASISLANPAAVIVEVDLDIVVDEGSELEGRRVLVVEDGPTLTHGGMAYGAGVLAALAHGAELVDPRPHAVGSIAETFAAFEHLGAVLPAMGYGADQRKELAETILATDPDLVVVGTPIDLLAELGIDVPAVRVHYRAVSISEPSLEHLVLERIGQ